MQTPETSRADCQPLLPLAGIKVLDLTRALSGPFCTMTLADLGADVIKIEPASEGDFIRGWGPFDRGVSVYFLSANRNKRSLALNFRDPEGLELIRELALKCDVLVENFKPGATTDMGLDYESLSARHPRLIYTSISGFGSSGPSGHLAGFDQIAQAASGLMSITGTPESGPVRVGVAIGDMTAGMWSVIGTLSALRTRDQTGRGQKVEASLLGSLVSLLSVQGQRFLSLGEVPTPTGNDHPVISPYGNFLAQDGEFTMAPATPEMWIRLCKVLELEHCLTDPRFTDNAQRALHRKELKDALEVRLQTAPRAYWIERLGEAGIPAGPINTLAEALTDSQVRHCGLVEHVQHPTLGDIELLAHPLKLLGLENGSVRTAPPSLGAHTIEILRAFDTPEAKIQDLLRRGVIRQAEVGI